MNRMKKFMALFLAVVLIAQTGFATSAQESASPVPSVQSETPTGTELQDETDAADTTEQQPEDSKDETTGETTEETTETGQKEDGAVETPDGEQPEIPSDETDSEQPEIPSEGEESGDEGAALSEEQGGKTPSGETGSGEENKEPAEEVTEPVEEEQGEEKLPAAENGLQLMSELDGAEEYSFTVDEENKTVQIDDAEDLRAWADSVEEDNDRYSGYTIEITKDIDLSGENWTSIISLGGTVTIEGNNHTISNMNISEQGNGSDGNTYLGFIGNINYNTKLTVQNLTFENAHVQDLDGDGQYSWCGVVVGHGPMDGVNESQAECTFTNVHVVNSVVTGGHNNGGILGYSCSTEKGHVFEKCSVTDSFIGGYNSTSGILFGMGIANVTVKDCSADGVRLYSDGLNFNCSQSWDNQLWLGNVYPHEIYGDRYGSNGTATYEGTNTATDTCVVYPVIFHIAGKEVKQYVPVNTELRAFDDVWFGDIFEIASGKTIQWYNGTGADAEVVTQIIASLENTDMYPYDMQALVNDEAYETQDTEKVANPLTHAAIELYAKEVTTIPTDPEAPDWETSKSKTATNLDSNYESQVTLSLPSAEEKLVSDVVFVLDESSAYDAVVEEMDTMLTNLVQRVNETNAEVKAGFVVFRGNAVTKPLEKLTSDSIEDINNFIKTRPETGGSNMLAGLTAAKEMLEADTSVSNSRKYVILISDGITYTWMGENGIQMGVNFANADAPTTPMLASPDAWDVKYGNQFVPSDWAQHFSDTSALRDKTITEKSSVYVRNADISGEEFISYSEKDQFVSTVDIALYKCAELYKELQNEFHCYAVMRSALTENKNDDPNRRDGDVYPYGPSFMNYLANGKEVDFDSIENDIYYLLDSGSRIEDYMGYAAGENGYNFDFINDVSGLSMKVGDQSYNAVSLGENKYGFAKNENGTYDYVLTYVEGNKQDTEHFVWNIYVPVSNFAPVQLIYSVKLVNPQKAEGTYGQYDANGTQGYDGLYTNNSATLYPVDSNGMKGDAEEFNKPTVSYTVADHPATINITKKVQNSSGAATNVNATFYAAVFTDPQFTNRFGDVVELKLNGTSQVTVSVTVEAPADGSSRSYYVTETDKNGNVITGGESFGYQIGIEGSMVTVSESAQTGSVTITNKQVASGNQGGGSNGGGSTGGGSSSGSGSSSSQTVTSAQTGDNTNLLLPIAVVVIAAAALTVCLVVYRRKRS